MAKALLGHMGGTDPRLARDAVLLRRRVADLETLVARLQRDNDELTGNRGNDRLNGGSGFDIGFGGIGSDSCTGVDFALSCT